MILMVVGEMGRGRVCVEALPIVRNIDRLQKKIRKRLGQRMRSKKPQR